MKELGKISQGFNETLSYDNGLDKVFKRFKTNYHYDL